MARLSSKNQVAEYDPDEIREHEKSILIQEQEERAPERLYGGRILKKNGIGITRTVFVLTCASCGLRITPDRQITVCAETHAITCDSCSVFYQNQNYCVACLKSKLGINEFDFNVLNLILESGRSISSIATEIDECEQSVRKSVSRLVNANLIRRLSLSILSQFEATSVAKHNLQALQKLFNATPTELKKV